MIFKGMQRNSWIEWKDGAELLFRILTRRETAKLEQGIEGLDKMSDREVSLAIQELFLIGWNDELQDEKGKKLEFNDQNRKLVFEDFIQDIENYKKLITFMSGPTEGSKPGST